MKNKDLSPLKNLGSDIPASIVVFLVALPLCLGIALASGATPLSGIIAGIVGGVVVGSLSNSALGVSGPAAGLAVVVLTSIPELGGFEYFLVAVILAGLLQLVLGFFKAGFIAYFFPTSVIHGMLSGIGILIFLKQIPHAFGYDKDPEGDDNFLQPDNENTFSELWNMLDYISPSVLVVTSIALVIILFWNSKFMKGLSFTKIIPGALIAVVSGILLNVYFSGIEGWEIGKEHLVILPVPQSVEGFFGNFTLPDFSILSDPNVYKIAVIITVVASLETLLCVEASDKIDPLKRVTDTNRELRAQGVGNIISGLIGGIPITQVVVRSSANLQAGGKTKTSSILHGVLLLLSIIALPTVINLIPLGTLAAVLLVVGFKLANPGLFKKTYKEGLAQFLPFLITVLGIVFTNMLTGIALGLAVAIIVILKNNFKFPLKVVVDKRGNQDCHHITLSENVTFLNKASLLNTLVNIPDNTVVVIDASGTHFIHYDALEIIEDFKINSEARSIKLELINLDLADKKHPLKHIELNEVKENIK